MENTPQLENHNKNTPTFFYIFTTVNQKLNSIQFMANSIDRQNLKSMDEDHADFLDIVNNIEVENCQKGFDHGSHIQKEKLSREGFQLGLTKGFEVGNEIAFYQSFAQTWLMVAPSPKEKKVLEQLLKLAQTIPEHNSKEDTLLDLKQALNAKFKQASAILKLDTKPSVDEFSW